MAAGFPGWRLAIRSEQLQRLPQLPDPRLCSCGGPLGWSHLEYAGRGRTVGIYLCRGCGLAYRGREGERQTAVPPRSKRPLPDGGHPANPVLDEATAEKLKKRLSGG